MNFIVMGVTASGKSTVAKALALQLGLEFLEGDDFHSEENVALMSVGRALTDKNRLPWLQSLNKQMMNRCDRNQGFVLSCSALKMAYRKQLAQEVAPLTFVYLKGSKALITQRILNREDHFMSATLVESQFCALQEPTTQEQIRVVSISIDTSVPKIIENVIASLKNTL